MISREEFYLIEKITLAYQNFSNEAGGFSPNQKEIILQMLSENLQENFNKCDKPKIKQFFIWYGF